MGWVGDKRYQGKGGTGFTMMPSVNASRQKYQWQEWNLELQDNMKTRKRGQKFNINTIRLTLRSHG